MNSRGRLGSATSTDAPDSSLSLSCAHAAPAEAALRALRSSPHGLSNAEAAARLAHYGRNTLPRPSAPGIARVFLRQFLSPLIYVLVVAALLSLAIRHWSDAIFIFAVLLVNAIIGSIQEYSAQRAAATLHQLVTTASRVLREGDSREIDAEELVPGDIVLLMVALSVLIVMELHKVIRRWR